jgi:hypothetical protein
VPVRIGRVSAAALAPAEADQRSDRKGVDPRRCPTVGGGWRSPTQERRLTPAVPGAQADATLRGTARTLLAFLLGRASLDALSVEGDRTWAEQFPATFAAP